MTNFPQAAGKGPGFPLGDKPVIAEQMSDPDGLGEVQGIPNAIAFNWVTIFVLGFGNLAALDFQVRLWRRLWARL